MSPQADFLSELPNDPPAFLDGPLIDVSGDFRDVADLDFGEGFHYREGYRAAAQAVLDLHGAGGTVFDSDHLVYPLVTLYRHRLELHLKELIGWLPDPIETHNLTKLWPPVRQLLARELGVPEGELDVVQSMIMELHDLDANATAFRYAHKRKKEGGGRSVSGAMNIRLFAERIESLCDTLDGWDTGISTKRDWRAEMEAEWRSEMDYYNQT